MSARRGRVALHKLLFSASLFVFLAIILSGCSGSKDTNDLYLLEELETASGIKDPARRIERLELFTRVHETHPYRVLAYTRAMETMAADCNDLDGALSMFDEALSREDEPAVRGELLYRKFSYFWNIDREKAVSLAEELLDTEESDYKMFLYFGYYLMEEKGKSSLAQRCLEKAAENTDDQLKKDHIHSVLAELYDREGTREKAFDILQKASRYTFSNELLGRYLWEKGDREKALESYIRLVAGAPGYREHVRLDSLYALVYPGLENLENRILKDRFGDEGLVPDMSFTDIRGRIHTISDYRGIKLVISAWSPT